MGDKQRASGIFNDAKSYVAATSRILPDVPSDPILPSGKCLEEVPEDDLPTTSDPAKKLPSLSVSAGCRLWVGNIDPKIREIHLLKLFKPFGEIVQIDYLFHKSGPQKGEPRGYAFIAYDNTDSAERARQTLDGKLAVGKKIAVKYASATRDISKNRQKKGEDEDDKEGVALKDLPQAAKSAQIRAIEAKLASMSRTEEKDFNVNPEIKKYQSMKAERTRPYDRKRRR